MLALIEQGEGLRRGEWGEGRILHTYDSSKRFHQQLPVLDDLKRDDFEVSRVGACLKSRNEGGRV